MLSQRQLFLNHVAQTSTNPAGLEPVSAKGLYMKDVHGKRYLDLIAGISVSSLGHLHPKVIMAIRKQLKKHLHLMVYGEFVQHPQVKLAKYLSTLLPDSLDSCYFVNSGSEAVEASLKLAKRASGRTEIIHFNHSYHGSTHGALSISGDEYFKSAFRPLLPDIRKLTFNDLNQLSEITYRTACVIVEPIQGEAGAIVGNLEFMQQLRNRCHETGTLLIFDEIQTGCGRTGTMFAYEYFGIIPDILLLAKGLGGGMPIGALIASRKLTYLFTENPFLGHITTFGGHPLSCAAALATIKAIKEENLVDLISEKEALFRKLLQHPSILAINGKGLLLALDLGNTEFNLQVVSRCLANGLITDWFLFNSQSLRIAPPLIISEEQIKKACKIILKSLNEVLQM